MTLSKSSKLHPFMAQPRSKPTIRKFALYGLILLALAMVSGVIFVLVTEEKTLSVAEAFPEPVILDPEKKPHFVFPESARTYDLSLNEFVDRFARVCMQGKYSDFRLMLSTKRPPILPQRFESNFNALKEVRVVAIERLPDVAELQGPVYLMKADYDLQDFAVRKGEKTRQVHVAVSQEDGKWRIGPIPREALARLAAYKKATSQPTSDATDIVEEERPARVVSPAIEETPTSRASANRPMKLDS